MTALRDVACSLTAVFLAVVPCGCLEVEEGTRVQADGTLQRTEVVSGDSAEVVGYGFISPVDSSWTVTIDRPGGRAFERRAAKLFKGAESFSAATTDTDAGTLPVRARLERRFLWFYSDLTYRERYLRWNPFGFIPLSEYVSSEDLARAMNPPQSGRAPASEDSAARERFSSGWAEWMSRESFESYYAEFVKGARSLNDPSLAPAFVAGHKEEIYQKGLKYWTAAGSLDTLSVVVQSIFRTPAAGLALRSNAAGFALHARKLSFVDRVLGKLKQVTIEMPGTLIDSNAPVVEHNRGSWKGVPGMSYVADYELWMTSRVVNWWMVVLTAVVIAAGTGSLLVRPSRA